MIPGETSKGAGEAGQGSRGPQARVWFQEKSPGGTIQECKLYLRTIPAPLGHWAGLPWGRSSRPSGFLLFMSSGSGSSRVGPSGKPGGAAAGIEVGVGGRDGSVTGGAPTFWLLDPTLELRLWSADLT